MKYPGLSVVRFTSLINQSIPLCRDAQWNLFGDGWAKREVDCRRSPAKPDARTQRRLLLAIPLPSTPPM